MTEPANKNEDNEPTIRAQVLNSVWYERERQENLVLTGRFKFTAANPGLKNAERLPMLVGELGEIATQVEQQPDSGLMPVDMTDRFDWRKAGLKEFDPEAGTRIGLETELIQLAAIAVAWVEGLRSPAYADETTPAAVPPAPPSAA